MSKALRRIVYAATAACALHAAPAAIAQNQVDITGWGTGAVEAVPTDPGRPWGWAVRDFMENPDLPLYNRAKQKLLNGEQIFSHIISSFDIERYCAEAPHYDYTWFEMQHSMLRNDQRSEEHTSELQSRGHLVCRLLLEKKKLKESAT